MDLGLDRVRQVWQELGHGRPAPRVVTVAGTNGKGSTVTALDALLRSAGLRTGATLSPHLLRFNERILIEGEPVTDAAIVAAFDRIEVTRGQVTLTYFEFAILAALDIMARSRVDVAVLEVGLGGRLDAVNVVDADVAVITSVALDHEAWLGTDRETIGAEKAGILRRGQPLVIGEPSPPASVMSRAEALQAPVSLLDRDFGVTAGQSPDRLHYWSESRSLQLPRPELHPAAVGAALRTAELLAVALSEQQLAAALAGLSLPGRLQQTSHAGVPLTLDVAHNPHAVDGLLRRLRERPQSRAGGFHVVFGTFADKRVEVMIDALAALAPSWYLVPTPGPRGQGSGELAARGQPVLAGAAEFGSVADGLSAALARAAAEGGEVLVLGSFTVVEAALRWLQQGS